MDKACKKCRALTTADVCPACGGEATTAWEGCVIILNPKGEIAKAMGVAAPGRYALKIRE